MSFLLQYVIVLIHRLSRVSGGDGGERVSQKQPKRGRLWLNDGSCVRLRPEYKDHVWSYDLAASRTSDGRPFHILSILDEYTRERLDMVVSRRISPQDVIDQVTQCDTIERAPGVEN